MKIEYMREFVDLASTRSFSRTAERLYVSQPTLSKHIKSIEDELRISLIDRSVHGVELTDAGRYVTSEFKRILEAYAGIESRLDDMRSGFQGSIRLGLLYYATDTIFVPILRRFRKLYPNVSVKTIAGQPDQVFSQVMDGTVDAGLLVALPGAISARWNELDAVPVSSERCVALVRSWDPLVKTEDATMASLDARTMVHYASGEFLECFENDLETWLTSRGITIADRMPLDNIDLLTALVEETGAFALMPEHICSFHKRLVPLALGGLPSIENCMVYRTDNDNPALDLFLSAARVQ